MKAVLIAVSALLLGTLLLMLGSGLQGTLIGIRGAIEAFSRVEIGLMMSAYYAGFAGACLFGGRIIERVGHIRTFAAFASTASAAAIVHAAIVDPYSWIVLRALTGACFAVLYMVIESWLNGQVTNERRGTIMAIYMIVNLGGIAAAQQLLLLSDPGGFELFVVSSVLVSLAVVPVALTTSVAPSPIPTERMAFGELVTVSPLGVVGALSIGLVNGATWGLAPLAAINFGFATPAVALLMSLIVLGGVVFQWPVGWASDHLDRRTVIAAATALLLVLGGGAAIGPLLGAFAMRYLGDPGLFVFMGVIGLFFLGFALLRMRDKPPVPDDEQSRFEPAIPTPASTLLDPRVEPVEPEV